MMKRLSMFLAVSCLMAAFSISAHAMEYHIAGPDSGLFGTPTSDDAIYVTTDAPLNIDRSKNAALIPPAFGSPTSYTLSSGEYLTANLIQGNGSAVSGSGGITVVPPSVQNGISVAASYTAVTSDLYYSAGHLGTLKIPALDLTVKIYQGTDSAALKKGSGHFEATSIWDGNVALAAHNRGVANHFGKIHTLDLGDTVKLTTKLGTRTYEVVSVSKISVSDTSVLNTSSENIITLITCVKNEPDYRWCVVARER